MDNIKEIKDDFENLLTDEELADIYEAIVEAEEYQRKMKEKNYESH